MNKRQFLGILMIILGMVGCRESNPEILRVNPEILPYCSFPPGSYWIYEEENTPGWTDSVYVISSWTTVLPDQTGEGFETECHKNTMGLRGLPYGQTLCPWSFNDETYEVFSEMTETLSDSSGFKSDIVFFWNPRDFRTLPSYPNAITLSHVDSMEVKGTIYLDVYIGVLGIGAQVTSNAAWARHVGIVKRIMADGTSWNLVRYSIKH